jgi:hypothetical protein
MQATFFLKIQYPDKGTFFLVETLKIFQEFLQCEIFFLPGIDSSVEISRKIEKEYSKYL